MSHLHSSAIDSFANNRKSPASSKIMRQVEIGEMKLNVLWSKLIIKQIKQILPSFIEFSAITDSNLCFSPHKSLSPFFSFFFYLIICCFSLFTDLTHFWGENNILKEISENITSLLHIPPTVDPTYIFSTPPFLIIVIFFLYSFAGYFSIFVQKFKNYFCHRQIYEAALFLTETISLPIFVYEIGNIPIHIIHCISLQGQCRIVYGALVIISILSLPYLFLVISRTFSDVKISGFPFLSTNCIGAFKQIFSISIICSLIPIFCNIKSKDSQYRSWLFLSIVVLSVFNIYKSLFFPSFLQLSTRVFILSSILALFFNSSIAYISLFTIKSENCFPAYLFIVVDFICPIISYLYYRFTGIKLRSLLLSHQNDVSKLGDDTIFLMYACHDSKTYPILSSIDFVKQINEIFPYSDALLVLSLRFLYSSKKHPNYIFQRSAFLFRSSMYNVLGSLRLATLIELSNELMLSDHYLSSMRLNRLDKIIAECVEAHVIFWEAVLLDRLPAIGEASFLLYDKVRNASEYFKFLKIDDNSPQEYSRLYRKFKNKISIESSHGDDVVGFVGNMKKLSSESNVSLKGTSSSPNYSELMKNVLLIKDDQQQQQPQPQQQEQPQPQPQQQEQPQQQKEKEEEEVPKQVKKNEKKRPNIPFPKMKNKKPDSKKPNIPFPKMKSSNLPLKRLGSTPILEDISANMLKNNLSNSTDQDDTENNNNFDDDSQTENVNDADKKEDEKENKKKFDENIIDKKLILKSFGEKLNEPNEQISYPESRKKAFHLNRVRHRSDYDTFERLIRADNNEFTINRGSIVETVKNYKIDGQTFRNRVLLFFFFSTILAFFGILVSVSIKYSQFTTLMHDSLDYFNANCALFRSSYHTIFNIIFNKNDLSDNFFFIYDSFLINHFNKEKSFKTIEKSRAILRESSSTIFRDPKIQQKEESLYNSLFDKYEKIINNNCTCMKELITSDDFLETTRLLTEIGRDLIFKDFNQTRKILDKTFDYNQFVHNIYKIIGFISLIEVPLFLIICFKTYHAHLNIFFQPPLINKLDVRQVYQYYVSESKAYRKVGNRAQVEKEKKEFLQRTKYTRLFKTIFILFAAFLLIITLTLILIYLFTILFNNFTDALQVIEYTSFSCVPYITSIYQLMVISGQHSEPNDFYKSLVSNFVVISQFINLPHKKYYKNNSIENKEKGVQFTLNDYSDFICIEPSFVVDFQKQKHLLQLNSFYIFGRQLSYKYLSTLKLIHFKLIESIKIICNHPEDYSIAMLIPHEWFNIGAIFEQYFDEIYLHFKSEIITIKSEYFVFVISAVIGEIILLLFSVNEISYLTKTMQFITKILAILPNHSPFFLEESNEIIFKKDNPIVDIMPILDVMPISFITVDKKGVVINTNIHAKKLFKKNVETGVVFKPTREFIDKNGEKHYFRIIYSLVKTFPYHPYSSKFKDALYYILVQDITSTTNKKKEINYLTCNLTEYRNYIFPTALNVNSNRPKSIFLLDNFAIVEAVFSENLEKEYFQDFIAKFNEMNNKFYSAFLSDDQRCSFFVIFSSFNVSIAQKQHLRDAIKCSQYFYETFRSSDYLNSIKIAVSQGEKLICKLTETNSTYVEIFSNSLIKSAQLLRFCMPGEIICESDILNSIYEVDSNQARYGYFYFNNEQIDFRVFENGFSFINTARSGFTLSGNMANFLQNVE